MFSEPRIPCVYAWGVSNRLRSNGITLPFQDVVIATIAMVNDAQVWTNDVHFSRMKTVMPSLKLFCNDEAAE